MASYQTRQRVTKGGNTVSVQTDREFKAAAARIRMAARELGRIMPEGPYLIAEEILADIKDARPDHGVPVRDGHLRDSGMVTRSEVLSGKDAPIYITFGGASAPYALIQHETMRFHHRIGEARYLVRGLERWRPGSSGAMQEFRARVARKIEELSVGGRGG